jgi:predicted Zn finger-like uncharacterized protein
MSMTTQCPSCGTTFRVTPPQLQSQHGMVRCGRCATVFDGFKALATLPEEVRQEQAPRNAPAIAAVPAPAFEEPQHLAESAGAESACEEAPMDAPLESAAPVDEAEIPARVEPVEADGGQAQLPVETDVAAVPADATTEPVAVEAAMGDETAVAPVPAAADPAPLQSPVQASPAAGADFVDFPVAAPAPGRRNVLWACASLVLLAVLAAQLVYLYRGEIAASMPEARPLLSEWCKPLKCTVALPQRPRQITIEASDMQAADNANAGLIILTATLRNQATIALGFPALDVVLTNTRDHTVARRIFLPHEYLAENREWRAGMAPSAEVTIRLQIDSGDLGAAGFRLELMAAPAT